MASLRGGKKFTGVDVSAAAAAVRHAPIPRGPTMTLPDLELTPRWPSPAPSELCRCSHPVAYRTAGVMLIRQTAPGSSPAHLASIVNSAWHDAQGIASVETSTGVRPVSGYPAGAAE